ncbi:hypothetical protein THIX_10005 [Thiomonas sp. X19]|nr:hypothetical protein THIX_10005 [Thiomonas sp. X19]
MDQRQPVHAAGTTALFHKRSYVSQGVVVIGELKSLVPLFTTKLGRRLECSREGFAQSTCPSRITL